MRKLILVGVLLLAFAATGSAEGVKPIFYAGGGISLPMKPSEFDAFAAIGMKISLNDAYKTGTNFGGGIGLQVSQRFEIVGRVDYNSFSFDESGLAQAMVEEIERLTGATGLVDISVEADGGKLTFLEFMADAKFLIPVGSEGAGFKPFLLGGIGITNAKVSEMDLKITASFMGQTLVDDSASFPSESQTKFAFNFGAGFDWMVSPMVGIFVEGRYAQVALTGEPYGYLPVRGGLIVKLGQ